MERKVVMSLLSMMKQTKGEVVENKDKVSPAFGVLDTDIYDATLDLAFTRRSANGAIGLELHFTLADGYKYKETPWLTNRNKETTYMRDGKAHRLPGYTLANNLALITTGADIVNQDTEEFVVKLYNYDMGVEQNTTVDALKEMMGNKVKLAIRKTLEFKRAANAQGVYEDTKDTREVNEIVAVMDVEGFTVQELYDELDAPIFAPAWLEANQGKVRDRTQGKANQTKPNPLTKKKALI